MVDLLLDDLINGRQAVIEVLIVKQLLVGGLEQAITVMSVSWGILGLAWQAELNARCCVAIDSDERTRRWFL